MRILITGASGFVGSHLVDEALRRGHEVYAGIRATSSKEYLQHPSLKFFLVDFSKPKELEESLKTFAKTEGGFDCVIQNAGVTRPKKIKEFYEGNAEFSYFFAKKLLESQPNMKRFLYMSSIAALGPYEDPASPAITEDKIPEPITPYGKSKLAGEKMLESLQELPYIILRPTAVYGPREKNFKKVVAPFLKGWNIRIAKATQRLSFIFIDDLARVTLDLCEKSEPRKCYNLSDGNAYTPIQFGEALEDALSVQTKKIAIPKPIFVSITYVLWLLALVQRKSVHLSPYKVRELTAPNWEISIHALQKAVDFKPEIYLKEGLKEYVKWYKSSL